MLIGAAVILAVLTVCGGLPVNAASSAPGTWPYGLDLVRRHPWSWVVIVTVLIAVLTALVIAAQGGAVADRNPVALGVSSGSARAVAAELAGAVGREIGNRQLNNAIDLRLDRYPADRGPAPGPARLDALLAQRRRRLVLPGGPGSGKSTSLLKLARGLIIDRDPATPVPILVNLSTWDPRRQTPALSLRRPTSSSG